MQKPLNEFVLLEEYKKHFTITEKTIIAYYPDIYCNEKLTPDLEVHEETHLKRQKEQGLDKWIFNYLNSEKFRFFEEKIAYLAQLRSVRDRELRNKIRIESAKVLSSELYGNLCTFEEAMKVLKI